MGELIKLNIGCGNKILPGFINVDMPGNYSGMKPDVECDIRKLPFEDNYADELMAIHVVEHFYQWEIEDILREWLRVLKPGGKLILEMPCLDKIIALSTMEEVAHDARKFYVLVLAGLYGDQVYRNEAMQHKWCYSKVQIKHHMANAGVGDIKQEPTQYHVAIRDMRVTGVKC